MTNLNISIGIPFDSVFCADYDFEYISTVKGHFEPRLDHLTTRLDAVKSDDQHKHVDWYTFRLHFFCWLLIWIYFDLKGSFWDHFEVILGSFRPVIEWPLRMSEELNWLVRNFFCPFFCRKSKSCSTFFECNTATRTVWNKSNRKIPHIKAHTL